MGELIEGLVNWLTQNSVSLHLNSHYVLPKDLSEPHVICTGIKGASELINNLVNSYDLSTRSSIKSSSLMIDFARRLSAVPRINLVSTTVFFQGSSDDWDGFGCLFPPSENFFHLGVLYNDCIFCNRSEKYRSETWISGGSLNPHAIKYSDKEIFEKILEDRHRLQREAQCLYYEVTRWPEVLPNYGLELEKILANLQLPSQLYLNGNYMGGIGLSHILERAAHLDIS